jgi:hypothetical protein
LNNRERAAATMRSSMSKAKALWSMRRAARLQEPVPQLASSTHVFERGFAGLPMMGQNQGNSSMTVVGPDGARVVAVAGPDRAGAGPDGAVAGPDTQGKGRVGRSSGGAGQGSGGARRRNIHVDMHAPHPERLWLLEGAHFRIKKTTDNRNPIAS